MTLSKKKLLVFVLCCILLSATGVTAQNGAHTASDAQPTLTLGLATYLLQAPAENADTIALVAGVHVPIIGISPDERFYLIDYEGQLAWVDSHYRNSVEGNARLLSTILLDNVDDVPVLLIETAFTLYYLPQSDSEVIIEVEASDDVELPIIGISDDGDYYYTIYQGRTGWLAKANLENGIRDNELPVVIPLTENDICFVSTEQRRTVQVRVGYVENRTVIIYLEAFTDFQVLGQNTDDNQALWYALDKYEAAPGKNVNGDVVWVAAVDVDVIGNCATVPTMEATGITPL
jgi:hypothetical protein